jgi:protein-tyrosine kinase
MRTIRNARKSVELDETTIQDFDTELARMESPATGPVAVEEIAGQTGPTEANGSSNSDATLPASLLAGCRRNNWVSDPDMTIVFGGKGLSRGAEEFRSLRSRLCNMQKQQNLKSILVASALPGEGRSFVAVNLAQVLALQPGCRVLLIDADLRNPRLHSAFGTSSAPGFSEYLQQGADELEVMQRGRTDNLFLIPCGRPVQQDHSELVANGRLQLLIDQMEPLFDWIIIDSPPAIAVTDACLLADCCDGVLLVVRSHSTPFDVVRKARGRFREESLVGVVLNKIDTEASPKV